MKYCLIYEAFEEELYGGKAFQLGKVIRLKFPVPTGFALSFEFVNAIVAGSTIAQQSLLDIFSYFEGYPVAVRSSAAGEDSANASFAGQHSTFLNISSYPSLLNSILAVWKSAHAPAAINYRKKLGLDAEPKMGVIIQKMVRADTAGVLFNQDPITKQKGRIIEAAWGLGEIVVQGLVIPDFYQLDANGQILERKAGIKDKAIRLSEEGTYEEEVPIHLQQEFCLTDQQLLELHLLISRCEEMFNQNSRHDLEWAFENNHLYLLQRRSITT